MGLSRDPNKKKMVGRGRLERPISCILGLMTIVISHPKQESYQARLPTLAC